MDEKDRGREARMLKLIGQYIMLIITLRYNYGSFRKEERLLNTGTVKHTHIPVVEGYPHRHCALLHVQPC